jgi:hypothetical protein
MVPSIWYHAFESWPAQHETEAESTLAYYEGKTQDQGHGLGD